MTDEQITKIGNFFKRAGNFLIIIISAALILGLLFTLFIGKPSEIKQTFKTNAKIEKVVDSIKQDNNFILSRMYELERNQALYYDEIGKTQQLIMNNNNSILKLQKIYNEKIKSINNFNVAQLDSFFTNRYKEFYNK